jgi:spore germination protein KA
MVLNGGTREQLTERHGLSPLPQVLTTERPDRAAAHIMQGHVVVLCEGSPTVNVMPVTLFTLMATSEDSYMRRPLGSVLRVVRYIGAGISVLLPGYFMALALHHQGMLSTEVVTTIIAVSADGIPAAGVEMQFLLWVYSSCFGRRACACQAVLGRPLAFIGGLILGQAAVAANMVSTVVLIIVALAGMGNFTIPDYSTQIAAEYFRLIWLPWDGRGGCWGVTAGVLMIGC